jgi:citrate synthase
MTTNLDYWDQRRGVIYSSVGGWSLKGIVTCRGKDLLNELLGNYSYFQILIYSLTGRLVEEPVARWIEACYVCLSYPDHRIWCNQIGTLAAELGASPVAAAASGCLAADSEIYGSRPVFHGMRFIQSALQRHQQGMSAAEIVDEEIARNFGRVSIMGYTRPIAIGDERVAVLRDYTLKLGFVPGPHQRLADEIERVLDERYGETMNVNGVVSAFCADQGLAAEDGYHIASIGVTAGVLACYLDYLPQPENSFLPLRCDDIDYQGVAPRELPERFLKRP